jgi:hypothetical protein
MEITIKSTVTFSGRWILCKKPPSLLASTSTPGFVALGWKSAHLVVERSVCVIPVVHVLNATLSFAGFFVNSLEINLHTNDNHKADKIKTQREINASLKQSEALAWSQEFWIGLFRRDVLGRGALRSLESSARDHPTNTRAHKRCCRCYCTLRGRFYVVGLPC